jgi:ketosteroid isomerase-like protein
LIEKYSGYEQAIPDIKDNVVAMYEAGDNIIVEFVSTGTLPDGSKFNLPICSVLTFKDGKVMRDATYFDEEK